MAWYTNTTYDALLWMSNSSGSNVKHTVPIGDVGTIVQDKAQTTGDRNNLYITFTKAGTCYHSVRGTITQTKHLSANEEWQTTWLGYVEDSQGMPEAFWFVAD